ncbi:hypothetical protein [Streptomyces cavernae]|uniref:hypothetical protein n=1 Tax=Streptomyces cavernae TaxID=2259034 RepID=UPI0012D94F14|nr:hypothetical protein [Streptomyces cavernae]
MADETWAERLAARAAGDQAAEGAEPVGRSGSAWARVAVDRARGVDPAAEDVAAVQRGARRPRTAFERRILERMGYTNDGPDAA